MRLSSLFLPTIVVATLFAQDELAMVDKIYTLEELQNITITSSTGTEQKISQAPSIATVITAQQIERSSARTLSEVLQMVPGLQVYLSSTLAQSSAYDIRGIKGAFGSQILTLINGVVLDRVYTGSATLRFTFPASAIKRVEVIRGPGSAVYGADAFSGVINIITKDAQYLSNHSETGVRYGSFQRYEVYGNYGEVYKSGLRLGVNLSYMSSKGDRNRIIKSDLQSTFDGIFGTSASRAPASYDDRYNVYNMNLNLKYENLSMNLWTYLSKDNGLGAGIAATIDPKGYVGNTQTILDLKYDSKPTEGVLWSNKIIFTYIDVSTQFNIFPANTRLPIGSDGNVFTQGGGLVTFTDGFIGNPRTTENKIAYESTLKIIKFDKHSIRIGIGYSYVKLTAKESKNFGPSVIDGTLSPIDGTLTGLTGTPYIYIDDKNRKIFFLSLQDEYTISKDLHLTGGIRYDNYSDFGNTINPRIGLVWNTSKKFTTKLLYGRAFRAPSFAELYLKNNPAAVGNPNLKPETIDMIELGTQYTLNTKFKSSINVYWYDINNFIHSVSSSVGVKYHNIGEQKGAGIELELNYQASDKLLFFVDYAYRWTKDKKTGKAVANVPKHLAHAIADYSITSKWFVNSEVFVVADTSRAINDTRKKIKDYAVLNFSTGYRLTDGLKAIVAVRNLLNEKYFDPSNANPVGDYPMEGRNIYVELKYMF